jgi:hypothetical protein
MTEAQFELLKQIFIAGAAEVKNDANLSDWLMNFGGMFTSRIAWIRFAPWLTGNFARY